MSLEDIAKEAKATLDPTAGQGAPREGEFIPAGGPTEEQKIEEEAKAWAGIPYLLGGLLSKALPELREVYTEAACLEWGRATVPVARKYNWSLSGFELEGAWVICSWGLLSPAWDAVKRRRANDKPKPEPEQPAPAGSPEPEAPAGEFHPDGSPKV